MKKKKTHYGREGLKEGMTELLRARAFTKPEDLSKNHTLKYVTTCNLNRHI